MVHATPGSSRLYPYPPSRLRLVETILRLINAIDPIILNEVPESDGALRYEVFDRETEQTHIFQTEAEMYRWLDYRHTD
ncbi:MAG: hypothetical protein F6K00_07390 [Leptolyngbya sp. SIOISBB]|nr:hypothetical protein [Leptolyngbya sp. SIOISBB]